MNEALEVRHTQVEEFRTTLADDETLSFSGYIVKFDERSHYLGFYETVDKRAFEKTLKEKDNVFMLYNHDFNQVLGSTRNGTLELSTDDTGLKFELTPKADTTFMRDVKELVESGELRGCSFGFRVVDDKWTTEGDHDYRVLKEVELIEATLTAMPAYESSEVSKRNHESYKQESRDLEFIKLTLDLMELA